MKTINFGNKKVNEKVSTKVLLSCYLMSVLAGGLILNFAFNSYIQAVFISFLINSTMALSLNFITGLAAQFSLGHAGLMSLGAYTAAVLNKEFFANSWMMIPVGVFAGGVVASLFGYLISLPSFKLKGDYLAIVTLGMAEIVRVVFLNWNHVGGPRGYNGISKLPEFFYSYALSILLVSLTLFTMLRLKYTWFGRNLWAINEDDIAAEVMGLDVAKTKRRAFVISSFFAGLGGGVYAHHLGYISPGSFGFIISVQILITAVLGGLGSFSGSVLAAMILTSLPEALRSIRTSTIDLRMIVFPLVLIGIMILRPNGLLGRREIFEDFFRSLKKNRNIKNPSEDQSEIFSQITSRPPISHSPILQIQELSIQFGGLKAVDNVSFDIKNGELLGLIGPNGAGKTTVFNIISGFYRADSGKILLDNQDITYFSAAKINHAGIARTFQNIRLFKSISVLENVLIALQQKTIQGSSQDWVNALLNTKQQISSEDHLHEQAFALLKIFRLDERANEKASDLPYGLQRRLEIARALATRPKLLILDEPAAGMNIIETNRLNEMIRFIQKKFNLSILLIEHDMKLVMSLCDRIVVLNRGKKIADGVPQEVKRQPEVIEAYLGKRPV